MCSGSRRLGFTIGELVAAIVIIGLLIVFLLPSVRSPRTPARRNSCMNNMKQIMLALLNYEEEHGSFPPAYTVDENGNRLHSWRTLILPHLEQQQLYDSIDLTKPWDDPVNAKAREQLVESYLCPSTAYDEETKTTYLAVVGPECVFAGADPRKLIDITDGAANTVVIIDAPHEKAVHWMSPEDTNAEDVVAIDKETRTQHPGIVLAAYADGHVQSINTDIDKEVLRSLLTIAGGETIDIGL